MKFPLGIWPEESKHPRSLMMRLNNGAKYPTVQLNGEPVEGRIENLDVITYPLHPTQRKSYDLIKKGLMSENSEQSVGLSFFIITQLNQALNMTYPVQNSIGVEEGVKGLYGEAGFGRVMRYNSQTRKYYYEKEYLDAEKRGCFHPDRLAEYGKKIYMITQAIRKTKGIKMVFSQFIKAGCVPIALALEEMGYKRYVSKSHRQKRRDKDLLGSRTGAALGKGEKQKYYVMITGDKEHSPNRLEEINAVTADNNVEGEMVDVVILSRAGSEGLDFSNVRQLHIADPWYNLNRIDQIIGRAIRKMSHCRLPFAARNVELLLYATELDSEKGGEVEEAADLYLYRFAEAKSKKIGAVTRILKENSVDCAFNKYVIGESVVKPITLASNPEQTIMIDLKDKANSLLCDYRSASINVWLQTNRFRRKVK